MLRTYRGYPRRCHLRFKKYSAVLSILHTVTTGSICKGYRTGVLFWEIAFNIYDITFPVMLLSLRLAESRKRLGQPRRIDPFELIIRQHTDRQKDLFIPLIRLFRAHHYNCHYPGFLNNVKCYIVAIELISHGGVVNEHGILRAIDTGRLQVLAVLMTFSSICTPFLYNRTFRDTRQVVYLNSFLRRLRFRFSVYS